MLNININTFIHCTNVYIIKNIPNPFFFEYILVGYTNKQNVAKITIPISVNITTIFNIGNTINAIPVNIYIRISL